MTTTLRRALSVGALVLALGGVTAPSFAVTASASGTTQVTAPMVAEKTWHATVQCQIIRISDNNAVGYERADGTGNSKENAIKDAERNIPVPAGHYKRHCDPKRIW